MVLSLLLAITAFSQNSYFDPDDRVNYHLQDTQQQRYFQQEQGAIIRKKNEGDRLQRQHEDDSTYGVIKNAPKEALPSFDEADVVYKPNPLEQSYVNTAEERQRREYLQNQRQKFVNDYIRNAEKDGVKVHINNSLVIDDYQERGNRARPQNRNPSQYGSGGN